MGLVVAVVGILFMASAVGVEGVQHFAWLALGAASESEAVSPADIAALP